MSIVAALDKVLFFNASSKYSVLRMKTEDSSVPTEARSPYRYHDHLIRFTAVGIELPQTDTVKIEMDGEWKDGKYGLQLQVDHWQEIVPPTLEGVRNYLASGLLKGIGEKTADAIIEKFGVNALEILEHQPDRLLEIRGITKERLAEIKDAYAETSRMRVLMTLLAPFKVTPTTAQKIYQHFGPACADIVRQSPFNLCQVPGFGFKRIDAIVQKSGGDLRDPKRVHGALFYALEDARTKDGHLYLEAESLLKAAMQLLNERIPLPQMRVPMSQVEQELSAMIRQDEVVSNHGNVYLPKQFLQESETAQKAVELFLAKPTVVDITQPLERVKHSLGLNLSKRQSEGVEMVFRHNLSIITGGPGTGKTTVLKTVIEVYRQLYPQQKIVLGAPTGKASRRMAEATGIDEAQTLHSILGLHGDSESKKDRERKPLEAWLLIVDETSMVDMWLIHQLFSRLRPGTKVLLVGDADQLESVGAGDVFHELISSGVVPVTVLDEIFRQAQDSLIAHNARFINEGKTTLYYGEDFAFHKAESQEETAGIIRELYREQIAAKGIEQVEILSPFRSEGEASVNRLNEAIREEINPASPETPEIVYAGKIFRLNDRVMQMRNNYDIKLYDRSGKQVGEGIFNGDIGTIRKISGTNVVIEFDGRYMDCPQVLLDDLELSYAITIHKSMGSEYTGMGYSYNEYCYQPGSIYGKTLSSIAPFLVRTGLSEYVRLCRGHVSPNWYLAAWESLPRIEQICKANLPRLTTECLEDFGAVKSCIRQESETSLVKALALDTNRLSRLRTLNGGTIMLDWLQREKCSGRIIPDHVLHWLEQEKIHVSDIDFILDRMSEQQVCNYLQRQKSGTRDSLRQIISTWRDYLSMADKLGINTNDEIVYRVKLLRQRHDELVEQLRKRERDMEAAATARKYRKIAGICRLIKPKYEYTGEVYSIVVPSGVRDIMREGDALSHCVGKSDRYWERIEQQEAYILFLRKTAEIDKPYYTLEVEPNGTIRQKRTYFDRQNDDLKDAEKFLKEWQKVVSERLTESDREKAEKSKVLRLQEFEQLRQDDIRIHTGDLAGQRLVDVLVSDLMETAA